MAGLGDLAREYEAQRFPPARRLDVHGEGPQAARERALRWIQSFAHEEPGQNLLLIVERGRGRGRPATPVRVAVEKLLRELEGKLISWWQVFGDGSLAVRVADEPTMRPLRSEEPRDPPNDGRTAETAGVGLLALHHDVPDDLLPLARHAAELRRTREQISVAMLDTVLRRIWIEAQAAAMAERITFQAALERIAAAERERMLEE